MKKFLAKVIFNIHIDNDFSRFDEQVRIMEARTIEDAFNKARAIGRKEEESFLNSHGQIVKWQFVDVPEIFPLDQLNDGDLVYSRSKREDDNAAFISYIRQKSMEIQVKTVTFA